MLKLSLDKDYKAAIYLRLSKEDGDFSISGEKLESDSISNQRMLIKEYLKKHPEITVVKEYCDDGFTGANFERPDFNRMMEAVRAGLVDCIVVKDLSRFGREYIEAGDYIQKIFPRLGIRFIAINDNYDSAQPGAADNELVLPFKNLMNDSYCRDISIKVRSNLDAKRRNGQFVGSRVVFGYLRSPDNKNQLVIDPVAAPVVQDIFKWKIEGLSPAQIADRLNDANVPSPIEYKKANGSKQRTCFQTKKVALWSAVAIYRILKNEIYTGTLVQGKTTSPNHKVKKTVVKPPVFRGQKMPMSLLLPMLNSILFRSSCLMIQEARSVQPASIRFPGRFTVLTAGVRWYAGCPAAEKRNMPISSAAATRATRPPVRLTASKNLSYMILFSLSFRHILVPL